MDSSVVTSMHAVRGYFRFAHIDGLIPAHPAVYARLPKIHRDESRIGNKPATIPPDRSGLRVLEARRDQRVHGPLILRPLPGQPINRRNAYRMVTRIANPTSG